MDSFKNLEIAFKACAEQLTQGFVEACKALVEACKALVEVATAINLNKKLTKKKFCKLLQSRGIQRNEINKIIKDNKEPYTVGRLLKIRK